MKRVGNYFINLFQKFDIWMIISLACLFIFTLFQYNIGNVAIDTYSYLNYFFAILPILIILGYITNFKNKVNLYDLIGITSIFGYLYLSLLTNSIYYYIITGLLFVLIVIRSLVYLYDEEEYSCSRAFFTKMNTKFPLVLLLILGVGIPFGLHYLSLITDIINDTSRVVYLFSVIAPIAYLVLSKINNNKVNILDYIYLLYIIFISFWTVVEPKAALKVLILPVIAFILRANSFEGETEKYKGYVSNYLCEYDIYLPLIIGIGVGTLINNASLSGFFGVNFNVILLSISIVAFIISLLVIIFGKIKSKEIKLSDYFLASGFSICLFSILFLAFSLAWIIQYDFISLLSDDVLLLIGIIILVLALLMNLVIYIIRFIYFNKKEKVKPEIELDNQNVAEPIMEEEVDNEDNTEIEPQNQKVEDTLVEAEPVEEKAEEELEAPAEEDVEEIAAEEDVADIEAVEHKEEVIYNNRISFKVPEDRTIGQLTKVKYEGKLMFSDDDIKELYSTIKNYMMSYGLTARYSNNKETFRKKGIIAQVKLAGSAFNVYLAILPDPFIENGYKVKDVSDVKQYEETPLMIKVKTAKSIKEFKEIFDVMMINKEIKRKSRFKEIDYVEELIPNGEAILNGFGYSSDYMVTSTNVRIAPTDLPEDLADYVPYIKGEAEVNNLVDVYLDNISNSFNNGDVVNKDILFEKGLIKKCDGIKVRARGSLDKCLKIYADEFEDVALRMIYITNGTAVVIKH